MQQRPRGRCRATSSTAKRLDVTGDSEIATRINAYEMAYRMQTSAPELMDTRQRVAGHPRPLRRQRPGSPASPATACSPAASSSAASRFVQLYHTNWDHHGGTTENLTTHLDEVCNDVDQASAALVTDLKQRGLLDDTIVIWGGEFGRTPMGEVRDTVGRNHHIECFTMWFAGGGIKPGITYGETDELGFAPVADPVHVHDIHATILHLLGIDHERLTYRSRAATSASPTSCVTLPSNAPCFHPARSLSRTSSRRNFPRPLASARNRPGLR
jgi:arylsulfatase A-like enzyme